MSFAYLQIKTLSATVPGLGISIPMAMEIHKKSVM